MNQLALDLSVGRRRRDAGIARTLAANDAWAARALDALRAFALTRNTFTIEAFRHDWLSRGGEAPASHKAWGGLAQAAVREGIIVATGEYRKAASPGTHAHPVAVWRRA